MLKQRIIIIPILVGITAGALLLGTFLPLPNKTSWKWWEKLGEQSKLVNNEDVTTFISLSPIERQPKLEAIVIQAQSPNRNRARFLLATDLLQRGQAQRCLELLKDLEIDYPILAPYILLRRAQAYQIKGDQKNAQASWQNLLKKHPKNPVSAEALLALGKTKPAYWEQAINQFPAHPATIEIITRKLAENPNQQKLLMLIAKHGLHLKDYGTYFVKLTSQYGDDLTPAEWDILAWSSWEKQDYLQASLAYEKATKTPENLYRYARSSWLTGKFDEARKGYKKMPKEFPQAKETGLGLIRLSRLVTQKEAIPYLDQVINNYPDQAPQALFDKAKILDKLGSKKSASEVRQTLLANYSKSDPAAQLRWSLAQQAANVSAWDIAWQWGQQITTNNPNSELAPEAAFWVGKWAQNLGKKSEAEIAFKYTLLHYPESYFAWRSAVMLNWPVGDFTTVRSMSPEVVKLPYRAEPPTGSSTLKELHLIGQDYDAWKLWQVEFKNRIKPSVLEQYTDGIMRLGVGDNLEGIWMLSSLRQREDAKDQEQYIKIKHQANYWQALYPFPYQDLIVEHSKKRNLNPVLVTALIRQESRFNPLIKSSAGALGLMQVIPETAAESAKKMGMKKYNLTNPPDNVKIGTYYLDYTHRTYNDNTLLAVASYNAGPNAVADWLKRFDFSDPDVFAEKITYPETKDYVRSVLGNYWNYLRIYNPEVNQLLAQHIATHR